MEDGPGVADPLVSPVDGPVEVEMSETVETDLMGEVWL